MAKNAQFYLLNPEKKITVEQLACDLAAQAWRLGKRVLIACETEEQAFLIDSVAVAIKAVFIVQALNFHVF